MTCLKEGSHGQNIYLIADLFKTSLQVITYYYTIIMYESHALLYAKFKFIL